ncbi:hypothetical protein PG997_011001 [Apiospora hydei]|uniref:Uncharacterized protein n=1 Tax=Apiospora hydei TaxID=1337664 RepID=A0ABR1VHS8_9PEZI
MPSVILCEKAAMRYHCAKKSIGPDLCANWKHMDRGTEGKPSGTQDIQPEATSAKTDPDKPPNGLQGPSSKPAPISPDSSLNDAQRQLANSLAASVQNTVEKEMNELLKQLLRNSERQITLLKASLSDAWRDSGQTAHLRAALDLEEPWSLSDEALVDIEVGAKEQELHKTDSNYPLQSLCYDFGSVRTDRIAMLIILSVWGFPEFIHENLASTGVDPEVIRASLRASNSEETDYFFFMKLGKLSNELPAKRNMDIWLKRGDTVVKMKQRYAGVKSDRLIANGLLAKLMIQEWRRSISDDWIDEPLKYYWGLEPSVTADKHEYGSWSFVRAPSIGMDDTFMSLANMANAVSQSAVIAPIGLRSEVAELAIVFLLSFTGPWKTIRPRVGLNAAETNRDLATGKPVWSYFMSNASLWTETMHLTIRVFSPIEEEGTWGGNDEGGIKLSRVVGTFERKPLKGLLEDVFDSKKRSSLMFETSSDSKFQSSDRYFFVTELLRISTEWIKETGHDLELPQSRINAIMTRLMEDGTDYYGGEPPNAASWKACSDVMSHNWTIVFREYNKYEKDLLDRIERKTQEVKTLRDGVSDFSPGRRERLHATSVREATKGTNINEYILVFTVMTITYLPLGFVSTLYGMDMFDFEIPGQTTSFAITTVVVSLATYLAAFGLLYGVRQRRKKGSFGELLSGPRGWIRPAVDRTRRVLKVGDSQPEIEVRIDEELPPELPEVYGSKGKDLDDYDRDQPSHLNVISDWVTRQRRRQEADGSVETA